MYMAVIEGWNNIMSFDIDKETAKDNAVKKAQELYEDEVNAPYGLDQWTWDSIQEYFGGYIVKISSDTVMTEESIKSGYHGDLVTHE